MQRFNLLGGLRGGLCAAACVFVLAGCGDAEAQNKAAPKKSAAKAKTAKKSAKTSSQAGGARDTDWTQFRGPAGSAVAAGKLPLEWGPETNIVWKTKLPGAGTSSPAVLGEKIFITSYTGYAVPGEAGDIESLKRQVVCLNRADGKLLWEKEVPTIFPEQPTIRDEHGYASATPAANDELVVTFFGKSGVFAHDHEGKQLWHADVGDGLNGWGSAASPVLYKNLAIINASVESTSLIALDLKTGEEKWRAGGINESWNTPILVPVGNQTELVVAVFRKVLGFDPTSGEQLWECDTEIDWYMAPTMVAHDGVVYCVGGRSGGALAVKAGGRGDVTKSHRVWKGTKGSNVSSPVYHDGHLYWANDTLGIAYCAKADTGEVLYEERLPRAGQIYASPILSNDRLYYLSREGRMFVIAAKPEFEQLAMNNLELERKVYNSSPAADGDRLLLRIDNWLYSIGEK